MVKVGFTQRAVRHVHPYWHFSSSGVISKCYLWLLSLKTASWGAHTLGTFQKHPRFSPPSTTSVFLGREITKYTVIYGAYIRFWPTLHGQTKVYFILYQKNAHLQVVVYATVHQVYATVHQEYATVHQVYATVHHARFSKARTSNRTLAQYTIYPFHIGIQRNVHAQKSSVHTTHACMVTLNKYCHKM